jgi:hypothetical protein
MAPIPYFDDLQLVRADRYLSRLLGTLLPDELPAPDSKEFFRLYGEPLIAWIITVTSTAEAIFSGDSETLNVLASRAAHVRWFEGDCAHGKIVFPSLLSCFAEMFLQDLEEGALLKTCAHCGEDFVTDRKWTTYCSPQCAAKARQQRFLQRNPEYYRREGGRRTTAESRSGKL